MRLSLECRRSGCASRTSATWFDPIQSPSALHSTRLERSPLQSVVHRQLAKGYALLAPKVAHSMRNVLLSRTNTAEVLHLKSHVVAAGGGWNIAQWAVQLRGGEYLARAACLPLLTRRRRTTQVLRRFRRFVSVQKVQVRSSFNQFAVCVLWVNW